ncbi:lipase family protein [Nocardia sp. NPDC057353]|uniref:lipase family protein n=1 Tax=Nocardia sp. NPDC057353 TaxID=3346104 RepID=UPI00362512F1
MGTGRVTLAVAAAAAAVTVLAGGAVAPVASAAPDNSFFTDSGQAPLSSSAPGTVLASRVLPYHLVGVATPLTAVQIRYRSTDAQGRPSANVTSVLLPAGGVDPTRVVLYGSAYDSLNPEHSPSRAIAGNLGSLGGAIADSEGAVMGLFLAQGFTVIVPDTEGQSANFAAGPEYGMNTLDAIRAATTTAATGLNPRSRVGLFGYSGGAIATNWAAALAPEYAPEVNAGLVGVAEGGVLVNPARNLRYIDGSLGWAGVAAMAIIGIARSYDIDFTPYLNDYGAQIVARLSSASITDVLFQYPGLTWAQMTKPEFANPNSVPPFVETVAKINLGQAPTPTVPMFIGQGANGILEGTDGTEPGVGPGDGVMIAGDVRALARRYCDTGNGTITYRQYDALSHIPALPAWSPEAVTWLLDRFAGKPAPNNCASIAPGNSLAPEL